MPNPIDITGQRYGRLLILGRGITEWSESGKTPYKTWNVLCECGEKETIRDHRLPTCKSNMQRRDILEACSKCSRLRICDVCRKSFVSNQFKTYCSDACQLIRKRGKWRDEYYRLVISDPDYVKEKVLERKNKRATDPAFKEKLAEYDRNKNAKHKLRMATDPIYRELFTSKDKEQYAKNAKTILLKRRVRLEAKLSAMTDAEYTVWADGIRNSSKLAARKWRSTPEGQAKYAASRREFLRQKALRELMGAGENLIKRKKVND